jgi:hypothetical protein
MTNSLIAQTEERDCVLPFDSIEEFRHIAIPSPSLGSNDDLEEIDRKAKETKKKRQLLAFVVICVLVIGGVVIAKMRF